MKKILNPNAFNLDGVLLIARIGIAALMLVHGIPKLGMLLSGEPVAFPGVMGMNPELSLTMAVFAVVVCSILLLVGLGTRLAVIPLIFTMLVAVFYIHAADPFAMQELGLHYLLVYILLLFAGSGRYSLDKVVAAKVRS